MQKNILILGLGAFGFAIAKYLGENNSELTMFASEINPEIYNSVFETRMHPYFFPSVKLPENIELVGNAGMRSEERSACLQTLLRDIDIIISIIPCQFVSGAFDSMKTHLKSGVTILNLSKGIDNSSMQTVSEKLAEILTDTSLNSLLPGEMKSQNYTYAYLAGGMIASELVEGKQLGADIVCEDFDTGSLLQKLFLSDTLDINLKIGNTKNTELYAALKNVIALILGYYEGKGTGASSRGYYFSKLLEEMKGVIALLTPPQSPGVEGEVRISVQGELDFTDYALSGDLIATCFGESRNRLLGNMLGKGGNIHDALRELRAQNKIAEGYETLKGIYPLTEGKAGFEEINSFGKKYISIIGAI